MELMVDIQKDIETVTKIDAVSTILDVILQTTGMGFAVVARVTDEKWVACAVVDHINFGLLVGGELVLETTLCNEVKQFNKALIIENVSDDTIYCSHPTPLMYGFESYISMPIYLKDGSFFGTLCAIDPHPAKINNSKVINLFRLFADLISFHIDVEAELELSEAKLLEEVKTAELRDQFIAILGHDLRNPVAAISNAAQLLMRIPDHERVNKLAHIIHDANYRVKNLIDNILDFAKGRMGDGIDIKMQFHQTLAPQLSQVIDELQLANPTHFIEAEFIFNEPVNCDVTRIAQLFSNLLGNAVTHGDKVSPIKVKAVSDHGKFRLSVTNAGLYIPDANIKALFKPFYKGNQKSNAEGLGLGLFIAQEIAIAHGGLIKAISTEKETCFTLVMDSSST
jgi:signal transduction histidine kinase